MQGKWFDWKDKVNFKIDDVTTWLPNDCNTHIAQYLTIKGNLTTKLGHLIEYNKIIFFQKLCRK